MKPTFHSLIVKDIARETSDTVSIAFEVPDSLKESYQYVSGQYLTLRTDLDGEDLRRSYSLCSAPYENEWRVAVKQVENGKFSTFANSVLTKGMALDVMTPMGNFVLHASKEANKSYVLFASGSGITPILSIAKSALHEEPNSDVTLFYGNKGFGSIIFREEIEALKNEFMDRLRVIHILSRESLGNKLQKGRIDNEKVSRLYDAFLSQSDIDAVYVCGPESMIHAVKDELTAKGVPSERIHFELFTSPTSGKKPLPVAPDAPKVESNITIIIDDEEIHLNLSSTGQNLLDAAHDAGADLPYACKGGVCCTCKARVLEGSVRMDVNYALEPDEVEAGYILTCQSHPTSDKLVVSFDD